MVKVFLSHVCDGVSMPCQFSQRLEERLVSDLPQIECFRSCRDGKNCTDANEFNQHVDTSLFFLPIITSDFPGRQNCRAELDRARQRKQISSNFPVILPIKLSCNEKTMNQLDFLIDQKEGKGEIWTDFPNIQGFDKPYQELFGRFLQKVLQHGLLVNEDFNKDCKILDLILLEKNPTAFYYKIVIDICRNRKEYALYFFKKLDNPVWLTFLLGCGFFDSNPEPFQANPQKEKDIYEFPLWPVLFYLEKISCSGNKNISHEIMKIIRCVTQPHEPLKKADNYRTWWFFVKILANLPTEVIDLNDIDLISHWLDSKFTTVSIGVEIGDSLLPHFLQSENPEDYKKAAKIIDIVTRIHWVDKQGNEKRLFAAIPSSWLSDLFDKNSQLLGDKCGELVLNILIRRVEEVVNGEYGGDKYSYNWRHAIEDHEQNYGKDAPKHVFVVALRDVLIALLEKKEATPFISNMYKSNLAIIKRIVLYAFNIHFEKYKEAFWEIFLINTKELLIQFNFRHELYELFKFHFRSFTEKQQDFLLSAIDTLEDDWKEDTDKELLNATLRLDWLHALRGQNNQKADDLYKKYLKLTKHEPEHPEFVAYTKVSWGEERPITVEELLSKGSIESVIEFLNGFDKKDSWGQIMSEGLGDVLKDAVKAKQEFFEKNLSSFLNCKPYFQKQLLYAFEELWKDKKWINWEEVLNYCRKFLEQESIWQKEDTSKVRVYSNIRMIILSITRLIESGVKNKEWAFDEKYLPAAGTILSRILEKQESTADGDGNDPLTEAINTPKGSALTAFICYSLRQKQILRTEAEKDSFWTQIQSVFDREIERLKDSNFEFFPIAGAYLPNLFYLNEKWIQNHINDIFPKDSKNEENWRNAFYGYRYVGNVYSDIYNLLKINGHLIRVLNTTFVNVDIRQRIIENISVMYLRGYETLEDKESLFTKVLEEWNPEDILCIIDFFWRHRDEDFQQEIRERIFSFWRRCFEKIKGNEQYNSKILAFLYVLAVFFLDFSLEKKAWLLQCAPYATSDHDYSLYFLKYLDRLADVNPREVGSIYLVVLEKDAPIYEKENVCSIVEKLYKNHEKITANQICDKYLRKNHTFLKDLYDKYNKD